MSTIRTTPGLPKVSKPLISQQVVFYERIFPGDSIWNSKSLKLFNSHWSFRIITSSAGVDFRIKFEGPTEEFPLEEIILVIGRTSFNDLETISAESIVEIVKGVNFKKYEARLIRNVCSTERLEELLNSENILKFSIKFTTTKMPENINSDSPQIQRLETQLAQMTMERNSIHKSLNKLSLTESQVSILTSGDSTMPEVTRSYEGFKQLSRSVVFQLLHNKKPQEFGDILISFIRSINESIRTRRIEKFEQISLALGISKEDKRIQEVVNEAFRTILKSTGHTNLNKVSDKDTEEIEKIIHNSELNEIEDEKSNVLKFATFIWGISNYIYGNRSLFINWEEIGTTIDFDRSKYQSITRRVRKNESCFVVIPRLQRKPYTNNHGKSPADYEALCLGLVCPTS